MRFEYWLEYGIDLIAVDALAALLQHFLLDVGQGAPALPLGTPLARQQGVVAAQLKKTVVVLGEGLTAGTMERIEVLQEAELGMLLGLDQFVFRDEEAPLLHEVSFDGLVITIVPHQLPPELVIDTHQLSTRSVNELPDTYKNDRLRNCFGRAPVRRFASSHGVSRILLTLEPIL